jgi:hypothetical protein
LQPASATATKARMIAIRIRVLQFNGDEPAHKRVWRSWRSGSRAQDGGPG